MKKITVGIVAHVDSGKTTLSEAMLYLCGETRKLGRVDNGDSFLDNFEEERKRGITIFSKEAYFFHDDVRVTLLDTPGHTDFSAETERTFSVLDAAILVISATDGVQAHTETLLKLLKNYNIPTFIFANKTDISFKTKSEILSDLHSLVSDRCVLFEDNYFEEISTFDENSMNEYLENDTLSDKTIGNLIFMRKIFPVIFGSALKLKNVDTLIDIICKFCPEFDYDPDFGAKVFKITTDNEHRLTHVKITGGKISVKDSVGNEKINRIRVYNGAKYKTVNEAFAGDIVIFEGLTETYAGMGLGIEKDFSSVSLESVFSYSVIINDKTPPNICFAALKRLEEEITELSVDFGESSKEIMISVMGEIELEIIKNILLDRFHIDVSFSEGKISYRETIADTVEGMGHFEPLRHYAEVHLKLEPLPAGSGIIYESELSTDDLKQNYQNLIISELKNKTHIGVLTGSPVTDIKVTLIGGKAHEKHTESGDFRESAYRALRQGLRTAKSILLEPYYFVKLVFPSEFTGKILTDIKLIGGEDIKSENNGKTTEVNLSIPVSAAEKYKPDYLIRTKGKGKIFCTPKGFFPCKNSDEVIKKINYDVQSDVLNTADSVFCSHGTGYIVKWNEAPEKMHLGKILETKKSENEIFSENNLRNFSQKLCDDKELMEIFERTYGKINRDERVKMHRDKRTENVMNKPSVPKKSGMEYLLVDGYNIIFSWDSLSKIATESIDTARSILVNRMCSYQGFKGCELILVFDAYKIKSERETEKYHNITIIYTKEAETADTYIERTAHDLSREHYVRVASSDANEQTIILGSGAFRVSAREFEVEVTAAEKAIKEYMNGTYKRFTGIKEK